jgi:RES domain-containing protein
VRFQGLCYRGHDPKWAFAPTSGEGAKRAGGRFNPVGVPALYLALTIEGTVLEQGHGLAARIAPLTICSYEVDVDGVVDLRTDALRKSTGTSLADLGCAWAWDVASRREPASWRLAKRLIAAGASGIVVPSFAREADPLRHHNLVLWTWGPTLPHRVEVIDPSGRLPKNSESWR